MSLFLVKNGHLPIVFLPFLLFSILCKIFFFEFSKFMFQFELMLPFHFLLLQVFFIILNPSCKLIKLLFLLYILDSSLILSSLLNICACLFLGFLEFGLEIFHLFFNRKKILTQYSVFYFSLMLLKCSETF